MPNCGESCDGMQYYFRGALISYYKFYYWIQLHLVIIIIPIHENGQFFRKATKGKNKQLHGHTCWMFSFSANQFHYRQKPISPWISLAAGGTAGGVEAASTVWYSQSMLCLVQFMEIDRLTWWIQVPLWIRKDADAASGPWRSCTHRQSLQVDFAGCATRGREFFVYGMFYVDYCM